jgi:hypothetical protein
VSESRRGWIAPHGEFIESQPTPAVRIVGESLGGHEQAALDYMMNLDDPTLYNQLELFAANEAIRLETEFLDWIDTDGHNVIKRFAVSKGFKRVKGDE